MIGAAALGIAGLVILWGCTRWLEAIEKRRDAKAWEETRPERERFVEELRRDLEKKP